MKKTIFFSILSCMFTIINAKIAVSEMNTFSKNLTQNAKSYPGKNAFVYKPATTTPIKLTASATGQAISIQTKAQTTANTVAPIAPVTPTPPSSPANTQAAKAGRGSILGTQSSSTSVTPSASTAGLSGSNQVSTTQLSTKEAVSNSPVVVTNQSSSTSTTGRGRSILSRKIND